MLLGPESPMKKELEKLQESIEKNELVPVYSYFDLKTLENKQIFQDEYPRLRNTICDLIAAAVIFNRIEIIPCLFNACKALNQHCGWDKVSWYPYYEKEKKKFNINCRGK